jgi:hypothetical protein
MNNIGPLQRSFVECDERDELLGVFYAVPESRVCPS